MLPGQNGVPWCAIFVSYCFYSAGLPLKISNSLGFAYCPSGVSWFRQNGKFIDKNSPQPGDVVFFSWYGDGVADHVGIVESLGSGENIITIEGNTAIGDDSNGGQVMRRTRVRSYILGYGRPDYSGVPNPLPGHPAWPGRYITLTSPLLVGSDVVSWQPQYRTKGCKSRPEKGFMRITTFRA